MVDWKNIGLSIAITVVATALGGVITVAVALAPTLWIVPNISVGLIPDKENSHKVSIDLKNIGLVPATNIKFTIESPHNVARFDIFSTENYTKENSSRLLEINLPRLAQGGGSLVRINATMDPQLNITENDRYNIYSTYNQGSKMDTEYILAAEPSEIPPAIPVPVLIALLISILGGAIAGLLQLKYQRGKYFMIDRFSVKVTANSRETSTTVSMRRNGIPTDLFVSIPSGTTGEFQSVIETEIIKSNDRLDFQVEPTGVGNFNIETVTVRHHL